MMELLEGSLFIQLFQPGTSVEKIVPEAVSFSSLVKVLTTPLLFLRPSGPFLHRLYLDYLISIVPTLLH
jgi:hypothetical protein